MSALLHAVQSVVAFFGANNIVLAILGLIAAPYVDRLVIRRNRLTYRVLYNSKIGVLPEDLLSPDDYHHPDSGPIEQLAKLLDRMSMVVIRIRNTGSSEITDEDFREQLSFTFGQRTIWNARISDATDDEVRRHIRDGLEFFNPDDGRIDQQDGPPRGISLATLRTVVRDGLHGKGRGTDSRGVRLSNIRLGRRQRFKLVVLLLEPEGHAGAVTKVVVPGGRLHEPGVIRDARIERRVTLPRVTGAVAIALTLLLLIGLVIPAPAGASVACGSGRLAIVGSTVFMPTMQVIAAQYQRSCPDAAITTQETGSVDGVRQVARLDPGAASDLIALSDGKQNTEPTTLHAEQVAIVIYHLQRVPHQRPRHRGADHPVRTRRQPGRRAEDQPNPGCHRLLRRFLGRRRAQEQRRDRADDRQQGVRHQHRDRDRVRVLDGGVHLLPANARI